MSIDTENKIFTVQEVADYFRVDRSTIQRLVQSGQFPGAFTVGLGKRKNWRVPRWSIERYREANEVRDTGIKRPMRNPVNTDGFRNLKRKPK